MSMFHGDDHAVLSGFSSYLERVGRSPATQAIYRTVAADLLLAADGRRFSELRAAEIDAYLGRWREAFIETHGRAPRAATYRNRVNALRAFYSWMERFELLRDSSGVPCPNPMRSVDAPRVDQRANDWLRPSEDRALLKGHFPDHERLIVTLLRWSGLRVSEAVSLRRCDVDLASGEETIVVRQSKTPAGRRSIPLLPPLLV